MTILNSTFVFMTLTVNNGKQKIGKCRLHKSTRPDLARFSRVAILGCDEQEDLPLSSGLRENRGKRGTSGSLCRQKLWVLVGGAQDVARASSETRLKDGVACYQRSGRAWMRELKKENECACLRAGYSVHCTILRRCWLVTLYNKQA